MRYYSTNRRTPEVSLREAVIASMALDNGLYMPERIERLPDEFFAGIAGMNLHRIAGTVAAAFFGDEIEPETLRRIVDDTFCFDIPIAKVDADIWTLELFHGPTMAFKDVGARFMARILSYFIGGRAEKHPVTVLVATSGDTGGAVANGFLGVEGIDVVVLYPKGKVSGIQEKQFTTLGRNVTALEIEGTFDDCQRLVKSAFADTELKERMRLTSANSINVARFLPQTFYFFHAYAQLRAQGVTTPIVVSVPSGNFGNLTAGLFAKRMGLPIRRFIAANNANDTFYEYLRTGRYRPRPSVCTLANAMDVGDPNNFTRILDLYGGSLDALRADVTGFRYDDAEIRATVADTYARTGYLLDPHGACGYRALREGLRDDETGIFLETAHPAKFLDTVEAITGRPVEVPQCLQEFVKGTKRTVALGADFEAFKAYLLSR